MENYLGFAPIVILTKIDVYYQGKLGIKKMECPTSTLFSDGFSEEAIEDFMQATQYVVSSKNRVIPMLNYTGPFMEPDEAIELLSLSNLEKIKDETINYLKSRFKNALLIFTANNTFICFILTNSFDNTLSQIRDSVKSAIIKSQELEDDAFSFKFINKNDELIEKKDEEKLRIRNIFFNDEIIKSITKPGIKINYNFPEGKSKSENIFSKIAEKNPKIEEQKREQEIFLTICTVDEKKQKAREVEIIADVTQKSTLKEVREKMESKEKNFCSFLDRGFKIIDAEEEKKIVVQDLISKDDFIFVKLMVYSQVNFYLFAFLTLPFNNRSLLKTKKEKILDI